MVCSSLLLVALEKAKHAGRKELKDQFFDLLHKSYYGYLTDRMVKLVKGNFALAEDLVSDLFEKLCKRSLDDFPSQSGSLNHYLETCVYNIFCTHYNKEKGRKGLLKWLRVPTTENNMALKAMEQVDLQQRMMGIKPIGKACIELIMEGYSYDEIGDILEVKADTVRNEVFAARKKLREKLLNYS